MDNITGDFKQKATRAVEALKEDLKTIRTGRATPALVESMTVEAYGGTKMRLQELATIANDGPTALLVVPYDPSIIPDIERAIQGANLGFSAQTQGTRIRVILPPLTQEQRDKLIKLLSGKLEERRVYVRNLRDEARKKVKAMEDDKEISEDQRYRAEKEIDTISQKYMDELAEAKDRKEAEIREI